MRIWNIVSMTLLCQCCLAQHWQPLGLGLNNNGWATEMYSDTTFNKMFVAGPFEQVNGDTIWGIASWNGADWDSLGHGIERHPNSFNSSNTWAMAHMGNYLYVGGNFTWTGYAPSKSLSRWDGTNWSPIPGGQPNDVVDDMQVYNNELYICGVFDSVGNVSASGIAKWNGSSWQAIGNNYDFEATGAIQRIAFYHGNLYVGGIFEDPFGNTCRLAKWDGTAWHFMTTDLVGSIADVWSMIVYDDELYVSGLFYAGIGNNPSNCIMRWNDTTWRDVGGGVDFYSFSTPQVRDMKVHGGKLYCAGSFEKIGGVMAMGLASWDGTNWCGYNTSFTSNSQETGLMNLEFFNDTLYVAGGFLIAEGDSMNAIAKWIGGNFVDTCGNTTSISEQESIQEVSVYPNPARDEITFEFPNSENRLLIIYDCAGREIWREENAGMFIKVNVQSFPEGLYFFSAIGDGEEYVQGKFLIVH